MRTMLFILAAVVGSMLGALQAGCHREPEAQCLPLDPSRDFQGLPAQRPYCGWEPGALPEPLAGYAKTHLVSVAFTASEDEPCDACDLDQLEARLRDEIEGMCGGRDYDGLTLGCYIPPDDDSESCWIIGTYSSNYDHVPVEHGCTPL